MNVKFKIKKSVVKIAGAKTSLLKIITPNSTRYCFLDRDKLFVIKNEPLAILSTLDELDMMDDEIKSLISQDQGFTLNDKTIFTKNIFEDFKGMKR